MSVDYDSVALTPGAGVLLEMVVKGHINLSQSGRKNVFQVYHLVNQNNNGPIDLSDIIDSFISGVQTAVEARLHSDYVRDAVACHDMSDISAPYLEKTYSVAGSRTGDRLPADQCVTVQLKTGRRGRSNKGSKHFAPISESVTTADVLSADTAGWGTVRSTLATYPLFTDSQGNDWALIVLSRKQSDLLTVTPFFTGSLVRSTEVNITLGTVRKRKEKTIKLP